MKICQASLVFGKVITQVTEDHSQLSGRIWGNRTLFYINRMINQHSPATNARCLLNGVHCNLICQVMEQKQLYCPRFMHLIK